MVQLWAASGDGVVTLPSGRRVRGRGLRRGVASLDAAWPDFGLYLLGRQPPVTPWESCWLRWPDFRLPVDHVDTLAAFADLLDRAGRQRVEVACAGGTGRTGTAIACLAVLDGLPAKDAVTWARAHYRRRAAETPGQRRFVRGFTTVR